MDSRSRKCWEMNDKVGFVLPCASLNQHIFPLSVGGNYLSLHIISHIVIVILILEFYFIVEGALFRRFLFTSITPFSANIKIL